MAIQRQCGRVQDPVTGIVYNEKNIKDEEVAKRVIRRATDNPEKAKIRVQVYQKEMIEAGADQWFSPEITRVIDGGKSVDEVFEQVKNEIQTVMISP